MKKYIFAIYLSMLGVTKLQAQELQQMLSKFDKIQALSYNVVQKQKDLFSDAVLIDTLQSRFDFSLPQYLFHISGTKSGVWQDRSKLVRFSKADSSYTVTASGQSHILKEQSLPEIMKLLVKDLQNKAPFKKLKDTIVAKKVYPYYQIQEFDSLKNGKRVFRFKKIAIDPNSHLPFIYRVDQSGFLDGTNIHLDLYSEYRYTNYEVDKPLVQDLGTVKIPGSFRPEVPQKKIPMLSKGVKAPALALLDSTGSPVHLDAYKGKIVLLNFSLIGCGYCVQSTELLKSLHAEFSNKNFEIISIFPFDKDEEVIKNNLQFHLKYPLFKSPAHVKDNISAYQLSGYPNFYVVDKEGYIVKGFGGYSEAIGKDIKTTIEQLL